MKNITPESIKILAGKISIGSISKIADRNSCGGESRGAKKPSKKR